MSNHKDRLDVFLDNENMGYGKCPDCREIMGEMHMEDDTDPGVAVYGGDVWCYFWCAPCEKVWQVRYLPVSIEEYDVE
jgi:hypothetical protein